MWIVSSAALVLALVAGFVGTALLTDRPQFCATCHEMRPYVDAWASGPHKNVWCVDCHVGKSYGDRFAHKFSALREVVDHFSGDTKLPRASAPHIPDAECSACHSRVTPKVAAAGFDHAVHQRRAACQACHAQSGHSVAGAPLPVVGASNRSASEPAINTAVATVGGGRANVPGHLTIACTRCHDLKRTGCSRCHTLSAAHFKPLSGALPGCPQCHEAGVKWVFSHPPQAKCETCHAPSATHFKPLAGKLAPCADCHQQPGKSWAFAHPRPPVDCTLCHALPPTHFKPATASLQPCTQCHAQPGVSWKFAHPDSAANCQSCHAPPSSHSAGQCSTCHHKTGVSFAFAHPSTSAPHGIGGRACATCHPNGYTSASCTCHGGGSSGG